MRKFSTLLLIAALIFILGSCTDDGEFHDTIAALTADNVFSIPIERSSFADLVGSCDFDAAVRARVKRLETVREVDDTRFYGAKLIESVGEITKTVYLVKPTEVFSDGVELPEEFTISLPYGIDGETAERSYDLPILRDGGEYILLLTRDEDESGNTRWKLSPDPCAAVRVDKSKLVPEVGEAELIFDEFENADELCSLLEYHLRTDDYGRAIDRIPLTVYVSYVSFDSLDDLLTETKATQIIRCRVARAETILKPLGGEILSIADLDDPEIGDYTKKKLAKSLCTPYVLAVSEVLWQTEDIPESVILYAPFGIYGEYSSREYDYPILKEGGEYILVLRREANGEYVLAFTPQIMPILGEDYVTNAYSERYFGQYKTVAELTVALRGGAK